jgi:hypothetical protein
MNEPPDYPLNPAPGITEQAIPPGLEEVFGPAEICFPAASILIDAFTIMGTTLVDGILGVVIRDRIDTWAILTPHPENAGLLCMIRIIHGMI